MWCRTLFIIGRILFSSYGLVKLGVFMNWVLKKKLWERGEKKNICEIGLEKREKTTCCQSDRQHGFFYFLFFKKQQIARQTVGRDCHFF